LKVARREDEPGKGAFWSIDPQQLKHFDGLNFRKKVGKAMMIGPVNDPSLPEKVKVKVKKEVGTKSPAPPGPHGVYKPPASTSTAPARPGSALPAPRPATTNRPPVGASLSHPLPIVISPIPASYIRPPLPPSSSTSPPDELTTALLRDPPIVLHEGRLILNPTIFEKLTAEELAKLQLIKASEALQILQGFVVQFFKEKMKKKKRDEKAAKEEAEGGAVKAGEAAGLEVPHAARIGTASTTPATMTGSTASASAAVNPSNKRKLDKVDIKEEEIARVVDPSPIPLTASDATMTTASTGTKRKGANEGDDSEIEIVEMEDKIVSPKKKGGSIKKAAKLSASSSTPRSIPSGANR
jgi:hypothetical protein